MVQQKYFKFLSIDDSICLMSFIGRITEQKGVHLILQSLDQLLARYSGKIQVYLKIKTLNLIFYKFSLFWGDKQI